MKIKELIDIPMYQFKDAEFFIGDTVRQYSCGFANDIPYKYSYSEGVVIETADKTLGEKYLVVKWNRTVVFGKEYPCSLPHNNNRVFPISKHTPFLVRLSQREFPFKD